jgi:hypothetical protein
VSTYRHLQIAERRHRRSDDVWSLAYATTDQDLLESLRLVQRRYELRGYLPGGADHADLTLYHVLPGSRTILIKAAERIVATATYVPDSPLGLPSERVFGPEVDEIRSAGRRLVEISGLAIEESVRAHDRAKLAVWLFQTIEDLARSSGNTDDLVITVNPRHVPYYSGRLGFNQVAGPRPFAAVQGADAVLLRHTKEAGGHHLRWWARKRQENAAFVRPFVEQTQPWVWDSRRLATWAQRMRFGLGYVTETCCSYLRGLFPEFEWSGRCHEAVARQMRHDSPATVTLGEHVVMANA